MRGNTEVTQREWRALMGDDPSLSDRCVGNSCPVQGVTWYGAVAYTNTLSLAEGLPRCYADEAGFDYDRVDANASLIPVLRNGLLDCTGYRLPTEAEWEYAARAGTATASDNGPVGDVDCGVDASLNPIAWYCANAVQRGRPVGGKRANARSLYDMLGNVWEWNHDWYADYSGGEGMDPRGPAAGVNRTSRGGSWEMGARFTRAAFRGRGFPDGRGGSTGFRPARSLP